MRNKTAVRLWSTMFLLCLLAPSLLSQTAGTGALSGTVTDPSGALVPNATVTLTSSGTGQVRTGTTGSDGVYTITLLPPGEYRVKFEASGFSPVDVPSVTVTVTETAVLNTSLKVGSTSQEVTVQATEEAVQTTNSTLGTVIATKTMTDIPLSTRNYTNMIAMTAGASAPVNNATAMGKGGLTVAVNGSTGNENNYQMDGIPVNVLFSGETAVESITGWYMGLVIPSPDSIQEFKIQTSNYDASYGRDTGANVNVVTKSGTNLFHGDAFEFFRNTVLNANDWFRNYTGGGRLPFDQNQFGGTLGGPIKKDKLFFFASYQQTGQKNGIAAYGYTSVTLPGIPGPNSASTGYRGTCPVGWTLISQCNAAGQAFIGALGNSVCPTNAANAAYKKFDTTTIGGIQVACDGSNINPVAINLLQLQLPNGNYLLQGSGSNAYSAQTYSDPAIYKEWQGIGNIDYLLNAKNTLSIRFMGAPSTDLEPLGTGGATLPGTPVAAVRSYYVANVKLTTVLSNSLVNEARVGYSYGLSIESDPTPLTNSQVGIQSISPSFDDLTYFTISGIYNFGPYWFSDGNSRVHTYTYGDQMSWQHGKHSIRFGADFEHTDINVTIKGLQTGDPQFGSFPDFLIGRAACPAGTFGPGAGQCNTSNPGSSNGTQTSSLSSLGGNCTAVCASVNAFNNHFLQNFFTNEMSTYFQDDFRVMPHLVLNLGLRWEYDGDATERGGEWSDVWPSIVEAQPYPGSSPATGSLVGYVVPANFPGPIPAGVVRNFSNFITNTPPKDLFSPRLGFAWTPLSSSKLAIRGGVGTFYDRPNGEVLILTTDGAPPYVNGIVVSSASSLANPFVLPPTVAGPPGTPGWPIRWVNYANGQSSNLVPAAAEPIQKVTTVYQWNLNAQYAFLPGWVLELGYVGSHGVHLSSNFPTETPNYPANLAMLASASDPICAGSSGNCVTTNTVANDSLRVPLLGFSPLFNPNEDAGHTKFNSLQATVRKQLSHGLTFQAAFTWNRSFSNAYFGNPNAGPGTLGYVDGYTLNPLYYAKRLVVNYSWQIPVGKHEGVLERVLDGWGVSGVTTVQNGTPLTIYDTRAGTAFDPSPAASLSGAVPLAQFCAGMGPANVPTSGSIESKVISGLTGGPGYLNKTGVFCAPPVIGNDGAATGFGDGGSGYLLGPGQFDFDTALTKDTKVGGLREDATLQFRAEFFNLFNHPQFSNPNTTANSGSFGRITTASVNPRLVQLALKYIF